MWGRKLGCFVRSEGSSGMGGGLAAGGVTCDTCDVALLQDSFLYCMCAVNVIVSQNNTL